MGRSDETGKAPASRQAFRTVLRHWRRDRGLSQFALAEDTGISTRHLSFLETGRSQPSRDMVRRLADSLDLPPADRNVLLLSAGYAPTYPADDPEADAFEPLERMLELILAQQTSVPALVIDEGWNIRMRNAAAVRVFGAFRETYRLPDDVADNALHVLCHPNGLRQFMPNWRDYVEPFVREIDREATMAVHSDAEGLRDAVRAYPGLPEADGVSAARGGPMPSPLMMELQGRDTSLSFYTAFTTFSLPSALKPRSVKIEWLYPADRVTARSVHDMAASP